MTIDDYFAAIERGLRQNIRVSRIEEPITLLASDANNGLIRCRVHFWDSSYLDVYEVVSTDLDYPVRLHYATTYLRKEGACLSLRQCASSPRDCDASAPQASWRRGSACASRFARFGPSAGRD